MRDFVFGNDYKYGLLETSIEDKLCHVYHCDAPRCILADKFKLGFERDDNFYYLHIEKGLSYQGQYNQMLQQLISVGTLRFNDFDDIKAFLQSLSFLFK